MFFRKPADLVVSPLGSSTRPLFQRRDFNRPAPEGAKQLLDLNFQTPKTRTRQTSMDCLRYKELLLIGFANTSSVFRGRSTASEAHSTSVTVGHFLFE